MASRVGLCVAASDRLEDWAMLREHRSSEGRVHQRQAVQTHVDRSVLLQYPH
jgi:hypothetical protein